jgi:hypothetical protein
MSNKTTPLLGSKNKKKTGSDQVEVQEECWAKLPEKMDF